MFDRERFWCVYVAPQHKNKTAHLFPSLHKSHKYKVRRSEAVLLILGYTTIFFICLSSTSAENNRLFMLSKAISEQANTMISAMFNLA